MDEKVNYLGPSDVKYSTKTQNPLPMLQQLKREETGIFAELRYNTRGVRTSMVDFAITGEHNLFPSDGVPLSIEEVALLSFLEGGSSAQYWLEQIGMHIDPTHIAGSSELYSLASKGLVERVETSRGEPTLSRLPYELTDAAKWMTYKATYTK